MSVAVRTVVEALEARQLLSGAPELQPARFAMRGDELAFFADFADADAGEGHSATADWGDGSSVELLSLDEPGTFSAAGSESGAAYGRHRYALAGARTVTLTVLDAGGHAVTQQFTALVGQGDGEPVVGPTAVSADALAGNGGDALASDALAQPTIAETTEPDDTPPAVQAVYVGSTVPWSADFLSDLEAHNLGSATYGFAIPAGADQTKPMPWLNLDRIAVQFTEDVSALPDDLTIYGVNAALYALADPSTFIYDSSTFTAMWTLSAPLPPDRFLLELDGSSAAAVADIAVNPLDGAWSNADINESFPSGGRPGSDFEFRMDVMPGDADRNGRVDAFDTLGARAKEGSNTTTNTANYSPWYDVDGNGQIDAFDTLGIRAMQGTALPTTITPGAPTASSLTAAAISTSRIELTWSNSAGYTSGLQIERSTSSDFAGATEFEVEAGTTDFIDRGLSAGTTYYYRVRPFQGYQIPVFFNYSDPASAMTTAAPPPAAPTGLAAAPVTGDQVALTWTDNASDEDGFDIERSTAADFSTGVATFSTFGDAVTFDDAELVAGTTYYYRARAYRGADVSSYSDVAAAAPFTVPAVVVGLTAAYDQGSVNLSWDAAAGATGYNVYRSVDDGALTLVQSGRADTSWSDASPPADADVGYSVSAVGPGGEGPLSSAAHVQTLPTAPAGVAAAALTETRVAVVWEDRSRTEQGFRVRRSEVGSGEWSQVGSVGPGASRFDDSTVKPGKSYAYEVAAYSGAGESVAAAASAVSVPSLHPSGGPPRAPSGVSVVQTVAKTPTRPAEFLVSWADNSDDEDGFEVTCARRFVDFDYPGGAEGPTLVPANATSTTLIMEFPLEFPYEYTFYVRAKNGSSASPWVASGVFKPAPDLTVAPLPNPISVYAGPMFDGQGISLQFDANSNNYTAFEVKATPDGGDEEIFLLSGAPSVVLRVARPHTHYSVAIRGYNDRGFSGWVTAQERNGLPATTGDFPVPQRPSVNPVVVQPEEPLAYQVEIPYSPFPQGQSGWYWIEVAEDPEFVFRVTFDPANPSGPQAVNTGASFRLSNLEVGTTYYARLHVILDDPQHQTEHGDVSDPAPFVPLKSNRPQPAFSLTALDPTAAEEGRNPARFLVTRAGDEGHGAATTLTLDTAAPDTAVMGQDYESISLTAAFAPRQVGVILEAVPIDDELVEPAEQITLAFADGRKATAQLASNDTVIQLDVTDATAFEPSGSTGKFRLRRTGNTDGPLDVFVQTGGTATEQQTANGPGDYTKIAKPVHFEPGQAEAFVTVVPLSDADNEDDETVTLQLRADQPPAGVAPRYTFDAAAATGTVTIQDRWVTEVKWMGIQEADGQENLKEDDIPANKGSYRFYPEATSPTSTVVHNRVDISAFLNKPVPAGETVAVYYEIFDVDDPVDFGGVIDPNDAPGNQHMVNQYNGGDNRGGPYGAMTSSETLGKNQSVSQVRFVMNNPRPGDNFRVFATTSTALKGRVKVDPTKQNGLTEVNHKVVNPFCLKSKPNVQPDVRGASPVLAIWRTLWVERDTMATATPVSASFNLTGVSATGVRVGIAPARCDVLDIFGRLEGDEDDYEGGTLSIGAPVNKSVSVYKNSDNITSSDTVTIPTGILTPANIAAINAGGVRATITDDDDTTSLPRLPRGGRLIVAAFADAYIRPLYVDQNQPTWDPTDPVPFQTFMRDDLGSIEGARDLPVSSQSFWSTLIVGCFQNYPEHDGDPDGIPLPSAPVVAVDSGMDYGYSGRQGFDSNRSAIFLETIRDVGPGQAMSEASIVTHEIGHTWQSGRPHQAAGILRQTEFGSEVQFDAQTILLFRGTTTW